VLERSGIGWWMIYVVTRRSLVDPLETFRILTNLQPTGSITLNPVVITGADPYNLAITPAEFADFLSALLPSWWKDRRRLSKIGPLGPVTDAIMNDRVPVDGLNFGACGPSLDHLEIDPSGWLFSIGLPEMGGRQKLGSIADTSIGDALKKNRLAEREHRTAWLEDRRCKECPIEYLCHGAPPHEAALRANSFISPSRWCEARKAFVEQARRLI
jgi:radical SAM protein with 4Fe4S-binding SPASM domain